MKKLFSVIAVISVIAAVGMFMTACGGNEQSSGESTTVKTTSAAEETAAPTEKETAQNTTAAQKSDSGEASSEAESKTAETKAAESKNEATAAQDTTAKGDSGEFAGISEEDAKVMALLDLVTEDARIESCKQGKDKNGADCWVIMMKDADNDSYISYVNADGSTTLPYTG